MNNMDTKLLKVFKPEIDFWVLTESRHVELLQESKVNEKINAVLIDW